MTMRTVTAAMLVLALGSGVAMARGTEVQNRVGAFQKGGTGVQVAQREEAPVYGLTGQTPTQVLSDKAAPATQPAEKYVCPMGCATSDKPGKCPKCGMEMKKAAKPDHTDHH